MTAQRPTRLQHRSERAVLIRRHSLTTRLTHWANVVCLTVLLLSGLQILNAYPSLQWGQIGADADPYLARIESTQATPHARGDIRLGPWTIPTTGLLGTSKQGSEWTSRAIPGWATLPSSPDLAAGRRWHFFFAWLFVVNGLIYLAVGAFRGHFARDLLPTRHDLDPRNLWREILDHARLRFPKGERARRYNALQKLSYMGVVGVLFPLMALTGLAMSPAVDAIAPGLLDLFGGRPSARTIHFTVATLLVLFVVVHVAMVLLSGVYNNVRSMITGRYAVDLDGAAQ